MKANTIITKNGQELSGELVTFGTKKAQQLTSAAKHAEGYNLAEVYGNGGSYYKKQAEQDILTLMNTCNGCGYRITGYNTMQFTAAWDVFAMGEDGVLQDWLVYETRLHRYLIPLDHNHKKSKAQLKREKLEQELEEARAWFFDDGYNASGDLWGEVYQDYLATAF